MRGSYTWYELELPDKPCLLAGPARTIQGVGYAGGLDWREVDYREKVALPTRPIPSAFPWPVAR